MSAIMSIILLETGRFYNPYPVIVVSFLLISGKIDFRKNCYWATSGA